MSTKSIKSANCYAHGHEMGIAQVYPNQIIGHNLSGRVVVCTYAEEGINGDAAVSGNPSNACVRVKGREWKR